MQYRQMGSLGWQVSALGFGCMRLPTTRRFLLKTINTREALRTIHMGIDQGINYIDTAYPYHLGKSETIVGKALQNGDRVKLVTKLPVMLMRKPEQLETYLESQLRKLQTDCLEFHLLHALNAATFRKVQRFELIDKLERQEKEVRLKTLAFLSMTPCQCSKIL